MLLSCQKDLRHSGTGATPITAGTAAVGLDLMRCADLTPAEAAEVIQHTPFSSTVISFLGGGVET